MHRRTLLRWLVSGAAAWPLRGVHLHAQAAALSAASVGTLRALAPVVLPSEIGAAGHDKVVGDFIQWLASYRAGAERGWGYGHPSPSRTPDIRTSVYDTQLQSLEDWPRIRGSEFASISLDLRAAIVSEALDAEKIRAMPGLPNGAHIVHRLHELLLQERRRQRSRVSRADWTAHRVAAWQVRRGTRRRKPQEHHEWTRRTDHTMNK